MATYIHSKMTTNANKGHRIFGTSRSTKSNRNGGKGHVRQIDSLRTRWRLPKAGAVAASATTIDFASHGVTDDFTILVPEDAGGTGTAMTVRLEAVDATGSASTGATVVAMGCSSTPSSGTVAETIVDAINGFFGSGGTYNHSFASANSGVNTGVQGVTAVLSGSTAITLTADTAGIAGNDIVVTMGVGSPGTTANLSGGLNNHKVRKRIFEPGLSFGGSKGTTYYGSTVGRTNTSVGDKDLIRASTASA